MNLKPIISMAFLFTIFGCTTHSQPFTGELLEIPSQDNILLKAEYYEVPETNKPLILLFHQAGYSRGEYREIAPKLNKLGFSCLAIDQRSGNSVNGVENEATTQARQMNLPTDYVSALPDLRAAIDYVLANKLSEKVILLGSSYSSSLIFVLGTEYAKNTVGIVSFSPGEYFTVNNKKIADYASQIQCPVFITSAKKEQADWDGIYKSIKSEKQYFLPQAEGVHGAKALWSRNESNAPYWDALIKFLNRYDT